MVSVVSLQSAPFVQVKRAPNQKQKKQTKQQQQEQKTNRKAPKHGDELVWAWYVGVVKVAVSVRPNVMWMWERDDAIRP